MILQAAGSGEAAKSGPLALAVILVLAVVCYFLFRSMSRHLKRVREDFPEKATESRPGTPGTASALSTVEPPSTAPPTGEVSPPDAAERP